MTAKCKMFMNYSKISKAFAKNKYDCQALETKGIIDVNEQRRLINVKYLRLSTLHGHYTHVFTVSKDIGIDT